MAQFRRKMGIEEFINKKEILEQSLKINLSEEQRYLNKWISEYEELDKYAVPMQSSQIKENVMQLVDKPKAEKVDLVKVSQGSFPYQPLFEKHTF